MLSEDQFYNKDRLLARLKARTKYTEDGHWLWWGKIDHNGYGTMQCGGKFAAKYYSTSRISAYIHLRLDLEDTKQHALHKNTCPYKSCWNPDCLYVGNHNDNMKDIADANTHCKAGHSKDKFNGVRRGYGKQGRWIDYCRECRRLRDLKRSETHYPSTKLE